MKVISSTIYNTESNTFLSFVNKLQNKLIYHLFRGKTFIYVMFYYIVWN